MDREIIYWCKEMVHWSQFSLIVQQTCSRVLEEIILAPDYTMFIVDLYMHRNGEITITSLYINKEIYIVKNRHMI